MPDVNRAGIPRCSKPLLHTVQFRFAMILITLLELGQLQEVVLEQLSDGTIKTQHIEKMSQRGWIGLIPSLVGCILCLFTTECL